MAQLHCQPLPFSSRHVSPSDSTIYILRLPFFCPKRIYAIHQKNKKQKKLKESVFLAGTYFSSCNSEGLRSRLPFAGPEDEAAGGVLSTVGIALTGIRLDGVLATAMGAGERAGEVRLVIACQMEVANKRNIKGITRGVRTDLLLQLCGDIAGGCVWCWTIV